MEQKLVKNAKIQKFKCDILSGQKFIENAKNSQFCKTQAYSQTVLSDRSILIRRKNSVKNAKIGKFKCDFFGDLQTL